MANPTPDYPTSTHNPLDTSTYGDEKLGLTPVKHTDVHGKVEETLEEITKKLGTGASNASDATDGQLMTKQADGTTAWEDPPSGGVTDHGALTGLLDDDHTQYHTDARGDIRYVNHGGDGEGTEALDYVDFDLTAAPAHSEGRISWNDDDKTLDIHTEKTGTKIQVGQEVVVRVTNKTGVTITNGSVVSINGAQGSRPTVALADADSATLSDATIGVVTSDIDDNGTGYATTFGLVRDLDTSAFTAGDIIYLSQTAGAFTGTAPTSPAHTVKLGVVLFSNPTSGIIFVEVDTGDHLENLHDVLLTSLADGDLLQYDSGTGLWKNETFATSGLDARYVNVTGDTMTGLFDISLETADTTTTDEVLTLGRTSTGSALGNFGSELVFKNQITEVGSSFPTSLASGLRGTRINAGAIKTYWNSNTVLTRADGVLGLSAYYNATNEREVISISANSTAATINIGTGSISTGIYNINIGRGTVSSPTGSILISASASGSITSDSSVFMIGAGTGSITGSSSAGLVGGYGYATGTYNTVVGSWVRADGSSHSHTYGSGNAGATTYLDNNTADSILMGANGNAFAHFRTDYNLFQAVSATHIPGVFKGAASQTANLTEWQNSSGTLLTGITSDAGLYLSSSSARIGIGIDPDTINEALYIRRSMTSGGSLQQGINIFDTASATTGVGGGIAFSGYRTGTSLGATFAGITGIKENSNSGDYDGALVFHTRENGNQPTEAMRLGSENRATYQGAQAYPIETITASSDTLDDTNHIVLCDATSNAITINLPAVSGNAGLIYHIKKIDSSANAVTIDGSGSETIDGSTTRVLSSQYDSVMIVCGSSEWSII